MPKIFKENITQEKLLEILKGIWGTLKKSSWRYIVDFIKAMPSLQQMFYTCTFNEYFLEQFIDLIREGNQLVKIETAKVLHRFLRANQSQKKRESILSTMMKLKNSKSYYERISFVEFAKASVDNFSCNFLRTQGILDALIELANDKVLTMRIRVIRAIHYIVPKVKKDVQEILEAVINELCNDSNKDIKEEANKTLKECKELIANESLQKEIEEKDSIREAEENSITDIVVLYLIRE